MNEIYYDAKGQRQKVKYENGSTTLYEYDPFTFRTTNILTVRASDSAVLQDLSYWYDPVGNITLQKDGAVQNVYFDGTVVTPDNDYTYDAIYRLIKAAGRELAGNNGAPTYNDNSRIGITPVPISSTDTAAMRRYAQYYSYDEVGNMLEMKHTTTGGTGNWTRTFAIDTASNRTTGNSIGSNSTVSETYVYDARGNITSGFNHLTSLDYNDANMLETVVVNTGITTYYQYDGGGQRVRKVVVDTGSNLTQVRKYVGGWELYQKIDTALTTVLLERQTLMVGTAIIDTPVIQPSGGTEVQLMRYQYTNHLGTATLELDEDAFVISYEEYYPYVYPAYCGSSTSFQSGRTAAEVSLKRYRYIGKERDEETGFYYMGARYYVPWIARWMAVDPLEAKYAPESSYNYGHNNPIIYNDPSGMGPERKKDGQIDLGQPTMAPIQKNDATAEPTKTPEVYKPTEKEKYAKELKEFIAKHPQQTLVVINGRAHVLTDDEMKYTIYARNQQTEGNITGGLLGAMGYLIGFAIGDNETAAIASDLGAIADQGMAAASVLGTRSSGKITQGRGGVNTQQAPSQVKKNTSTNTGNTSPKSVNIGKASTLDNKSLISTNWVTLGQSTSGNSIPTSSLNPTHYITKSKAGMQSLLNDIKANGINQPILYVEHSGQRYIVDGNHRYYSALRLGIQNVPSKKVYLPFTGYKDATSLIMESGKQPGFWKFIK